MRGTRILAISLGTRMMGITVLENGKFTEWRVKSFKTAWSTQKQQAMLSAIHKLISKHSITHLALKLPQAAHLFTPLSELAADISTLAVKKGVVFRTYTIATIKSDWLQKGKGSKNKLITEVSKRYSFLKPEYEKEMKIKHRYYERLFEAVAMADIVYKDL